MISYLDAHHFKAQSGGKDGLTLREIFVYYFRLAKNKLIRLLTKNPLPKATNSAYFNISSGLRHSPLLLNPIAKVFFRSFLLLSVLSGLKSPVLILRHLFEYVLWRFNRNQLMFSDINKSLRKIVIIVSSDDSQEGIDQMLPLRKGR